MKQPAPKSDTGTKRVRVRTYVTETFARQLQINADFVGLSLSHYIETVLRTAKQPEPERYQSILTLSKLNADSARLGNLLHKAINETNDGSVVSEMQGLLKEIRANQAAIKAVIKRAAL